MENWLQQVHAEQATQLMTGELEHLVSEKRLLAEVERCVRVSRDLGYRQ